MQHAESPKNRSSNRFEFRFWIDQIDFSCVLGAGGGYNERDNVEYNEHRAESDGEYDEVKPIEIFLLESISFF